MMKSEQACEAVLRALVEEVNRTLNMIVEAKSVDEIRWGATAGALTQAQRYLDQYPKRTIRGYVSVLERLA